MSNHKTMLPTRHTWWVGARFGGNMQKKVELHRLWVLLGMVVVAVPLLVRPIGDMDEIWNYNFGYNICRGWEPYTQFNAIIPPLSMWVSGIFLHIFGNSLLVFRILTVCLLALTFFVLAVLLERCVQNRALAVTIASFALALCYPIWIYNYNNLNLLLILFALYLEHRLGKQGENAPVVLWWITGLIYGLPVLAKQSVGALLLLYNGAFCIITAHSAPRQRKKCLLRIIASVLPGSFFMGYLLWTGSLAAFWDYAVTGVGTFTHRITFVSFLTVSPVNVIIGVIPLVVTVLAVLKLKKKDPKVDKKFLICALTVSWIGLSVAYPLCDYSHFCVGIIPFAVCALCCVGPVCLSRRDSGICLLVAALVLACACRLDITTIRETKTCELNRYQGLRIEAGLESQIAQVDQYILQQESAGVKVLMADSYAAIYMLPLDKYDKDFSLLNLGNLGTQSIEELLQKEDALYLVMRYTEQLNHQSHFALIEYIKTHYEKQEEVLNFDAYKPK